MKVRLFLCLCFLPIPTLANVTLKLEIKKRTYAGGPLVPLSDAFWEPEHYGFTCAELALADTALLKTTDTHLFVWDFEHYRQIERSFGSHWSGLETFVETLKKRRLRLKNKMYFTSLIRSDDDTHTELPMNDVINEHQYGLANAKSRDRPDLWHTKDAVIYYHQDQHLLTHSKDVLPLTAVEVVKFIQFLRYEYGIHPSILESLSKLNGIPQEIIITKTWLNSAQQTQIKLIETLAHQIVMPDLEIQLADNIDPSLRRVLQKSRRYNHEDYLKRLAELQERAADATVTKRPLEQALLHWELRLFQGQSVADLYQSFQDNPTLDDRVHFLFVAPFAQTQAKWAQNKKRFAKIKRDAGDLGYLVDLIKAIHAVRMHKSPSTSEALLRGLEVIPMHAGFYYELTGFYLMHDHAIETLLCREESRRLAPNYKAWRRQAEMEIQFRAWHPEYFEYGERAKP